MDAQLKILFVTSFLSYPNVPYAGEVIIYNLMERLSSRGNEIYLITGLRPGDRERLGDIKQICKVLDAIEIPWTKGDIIKEVFHWIAKGFRGGLTFRKKAALSVKKFVKSIDFDIIQIEHTALGEFIEKPENIPVVITAHDVLSKPALREYKSSGGIRKFRKYIAYKITEKKEISIYRKFDLIYTLSAFDKQILLSYTDDLRVAVRPPYVKLTDFKESDVKRESKSILIVGAMDRPVNIQAAKYFYTKVYPAIKTEIPESQFYIVGNKPSAEIKAFGGVDKNVIVTGFVDDIKPYYFKATVFVAPLFIGGGVITKILDAMAAGLPVIATSIANEGIEAVAGRDLLIADNPEDFAQKTILVMKDHDLWNRLSENGRAFVAEHFDWEKIVRKTEEEYIALKRFS
jgi:glycosyltransferase involved in cell wall biosynthesis